MNKSPQALLVGFYRYNVWMSKSILLALVSLFIATSFAGLLTPNESKEVEEIIFSYLEEEVGVEEVDEFVVESASNPKPKVHSATTSVKNEIAEDVVENKRTLYPVVRVIDGDTIVINKDGVNESVRLIGIDTPETVHSTKPIQCFGIEASKKTKEWLEGAQVELIVDEGEGERDKYRRLLGYIYREDGMFINLELIKQGFAYEYTYEEPYRYQAEFIAAETFAIGEKRGLWADNVCEQGLN